ncbi:MAG: hypothetical protein IAG13_19605 [Deltaproteobacteria bacterium]|nr:hypothetical protein [Nannocystaceae bacterium]
MHRLDPLATVAIFAAVFVLFLAATRIADYRKRRAQLRGLHDSWGQPLRRDRGDRPLDARTGAGPRPGCDRLDDATWADLDMARVFTRIDRTLSSVGAQTLHRMLRFPLLEPDAIGRRRALVVASAADPAARVRMQRALLELGDAHGWEAWFAVAGALPILPGPVWLLRLLPPASVAVLATGVVLSRPELVITGLALVFALPLVHTLANRRIAHHLEAIADVRRVLDVATMLRTAATPDLRRVLDDVVERLPALRRAFGRRISVPRPGGMGDVLGVAGEYSKAFGLTELVRYQQACRAIARHRDELERVLDVVGEIDAALSIACLHAHEEELREADVDPSAPGLSASGLRHPLVVDAVGNGVELGPRGLLVTGSNMAGKSTLLRAIGINAVLAQAIGLVAADRWRARPLRVATAMGAHDDLAAGVSLYRAEVERIRGLVEQSDGEHLFLLDEAFRGTNPHERIAASAAVLRRLARQDLVVAATHDRELCDLLQDVFALGFFTEQVVGDDVEFDYTLRPGVLQTTNAIALLERTGFPAALVAEARRIAARGEPLPSPDDVVEVTSPPSGLVP